MKNYLDKDGLQDYTSKLTTKYRTVFATKDEIGTPTAAATVSAMTDHDVIYLYTGSETGYTAGHTYYWNGSAWTDGGVYGSQPLDTTLTVPGEAADAKATGDAIADLWTALSPSSWQSIVKTIRAGGTVPNGTEFVVPHAVYGDIEFITRRMNVDKDYNDPNAPTVTIQTKYLLSAGGGSTAATFQYDRAEAFASVDEEIAANAVVTFALDSAYSSWAAGSYHFTATAAIPAGARLGISGNVGTALTSLKVNIYTTPKDTSPAAQYTIASGDGSATVDLGSFGVDLNHAQRVSYGSNNDAESGLLQFLNGDSGSNYMNSIWTPQTKYDLMNTAFTSLKGFLGGFPAEFQQALRSCAVHNITNTIFEAQDSDYVKNSQYTKVCKFWLPSRKEIYGSNEDSFEQSETQFPYFETIGTTDADKLMYAKGASAATSYWLRTPHASYAYIVRVCNAPNGGALSSHYAVDSVGVAPLAILA